MNVVVFHNARDILALLKIHRDKSRKAKLASRLKSTRSVETASPTYSFSVFSGLVSREL